MWSARKRRHVRLAYQIDQSRSSGERCVDNPLPPAFQCRAATRSFRRDFEHESASCHPKQRWRRNILRRLPLRLTRGLGLDGGSLTTDYWTVPACWSRPKTCGSHPERYGRRSTNPIGTPRDDAYGQLKDLGCYDSLSRDARFQRRKARQDQESDTGGSRGLFRARHDRRGMYTAASVRRVQRRPPSRGTLLGARSTEEGPRLPK